MTAAARPPRDGLSIGAVLTQLRPDFPDVTISKIRFLESEGLVRPARAESGYRLFTGADVERLRFVLAAQRDHYLPLKVIRAQLDAADDGPRDVPPSPRPPRALVAVDPVPPSAATCTRGELLVEAGIDAELVVELEQYGLIRPDGGERFDADAVAVARTVRGLREFGIEPRHLRAYRVSADREVGLLRQVVAPLLRAGDAVAQAHAEDVGRELAALSVALHTLLVKAGLRGALGG